MKRIFLYKDNNGGRSKCDQKIFILIVIMLAILRKIVRAGKQSASP